MAEALAVGGLTANGVIGLMLHGTGTPLGDPIEIGAATGMTAKLQSASHQMPFQISRGLSLRPQTLSRYTLTR